MTGDDFPELIHYYYSSSSNPMFCYYYINSNGEVVPALNQWGDSAIPTSPRTSLRIPEDRHGLLICQWAGGTGMGAIGKQTIANGTLQSENVFSFDNIFEAEFPGTWINATAIVWDEDFLPVTDETALALASGKSALDGQ